MNQPEQLASDLQNDRTVGRMPCVADQNCLSFPNCPCMYKHYLPCSEEINLSRDDGSVPNFVGSCTNAEFTKIGSQIPVPQYQHFLKALILDNILIKLSYLMHKNMFTNKIILTN